MRKNRRGDAATAYARQHPLLTTWLACCLACPHGEDEEGNYIDQRQWARKRLKKNEWGIMWRDEVARHLSNIMKAANAED